MLYFLIHKNALIDDPEVKKLLDQVDKQFKIIIDVLLDKLSK